MNKEQLTQALFEQYTQEELELLVKSKQWASEYTNRGFKLCVDYKDSWFYPEQEFRIWCWDRNIQEGFFVYDKSDSFLTNEQMYEIKKKDLERDMERINS